MRVYLNGNPVENVNSLAVVYDVLPPGEDAGTLEVKINEEGMVFDVYAPAPLPDEPAESTNLATASETAQEVAWRLCKEEEE